MIINNLKKYFKELRKPYYTNKKKKYKKYDIGDYTYGKPKIYADTDSFSLGKFCSIADGVTIYARGEHRTNWISSYDFTPMFECKSCATTKGKVTIGNDVWLADGAIILSGVVIGDGAVVAARSVVTKDVKPYEIVGGNPAKHIRYRFEENQINSLLKIKWWNWDIEKVKNNFDLILSPNINDFIKKYEIESEIFKKEKND